MPASRPPSRKLLVASIGVASMTYMATAGTVASCGGTTARGAADSGKDVVDDFPVGNLAPSPCTQDGTVTCPGAAAEGFSCTTGNDPQAIDPTVVCTGPMPDVAGANGYCCFAPTTPGSSATCMGADTVTSCPAGAYPFVCASGVDPTSLDPSLRCANPATDADGIHEDYCCVLPLPYPNPSCSLDAGGCPAGTTSFACPTGTDPGDPLLACTTPTPSGGRDVYCCISTPDASSATCLGDDSVFAPCTGAGVLSFICVLGAAPSSVGASLSCTGPQPDADGVHEDYCCTLP